MCPGGGCFISFLLPLVLFAELNSQVLGLAEGSGEGNSYDGFGEYLGMEAEGVSSSSLTEGYPGALLGLEGSNRL